MEFFGHLLNISKTSRLIVKIETRLKEKSKNYFSRYLDIEETLLAMTMDYVVSGMFSVYRRWFQSGQKPTADEVAKNVGLLSLGAVNAVLDEHAVKIKKLSLKK